MGELGLWGLLRGLWRRNGGRSTIFPPSSPLINPSPLRVDFLSCKLVLVLLLHIHHRARDRALQKGRDIMATPTITLIRKYHTNIEIGKPFLTTEILTLIKI